MKRKIFSILAIGLAMAACTNEYSPELIQQENDALEVSYTGVQKEIMINVLTSKFGGYDITKPKTRALNEFTMTPFVLDGDTLMYIVQYADGFEIYSAKMCTEMVLFSSETGKFDMNDPNMPEALRILITSTAEEVRQMAIAYPDSINPSWGAPSLTQEEIEKGEIKIDWEKIAKFNATPYSVNGNEDSTGPGDNKGEKEEGGWVLLKEEVLADGIDKSEKLIKTKWGQKSPWNDKTPYKNGQHTLVGCSPVAIGQYMYYTHYKDNVPEFTVDTAIPTSNGMDYSFSGTSNTVWDEMAKEYLGYNTEKTAIFLSYLGHQMSTSYGLDESTTKTSKAKDLLKKYYGDIFSEYDFDELGCIFYLNRGYPVLCTAKSSEGGHHFIVDQYQRKYKTVKYYFGWEGPYGENGEDTNAYDEEGNVTDWGVTCENIVYTASYKFSMNWGWGPNSDYDYLFYSPGGSWSAGGHDFNKNHKMWRRTDIH